jgi:hypothetical protein
MFSFKMWISVNTDFSDNQLCAYEMQMVSKYASDLRP